MTSGAGEKHRGLTAPLAEISVVVFCVLLAEWAVLPLFGRNYSAGLVPVCAAFAFTLVSQKLYMESYEKRQLSAGRLTGALNYSAEELKAAVEEAHKTGVKVAAHTYSDEAARMAADAGADSIEHGLYITEETFRLMAQRGVYYVPTLLVYELWRDGKIFGGVSAENKLKLANTVGEQCQRAGAALKDRQQQAAEGALLPGHHSAAVQPALSAVGRGLTAKR
jgi:Amidohydrolase family